MKRPVEALHACRAAADRPDSPLVAIAWGLALGLWVVLAGLVGFGAIGGVAALMARLFGLDMPASVVVSVGMCGIFAAWTGWLATAGLSKAGGRR